MHSSFGICFFNFFCWLYLKEQSSFSIWKPMFPSPRMLTGGSSKDVWPRWKWRSNRHKWREQRSGPRAWLGSDMCVSNVERGGWRQDEILHIVISSLSLYQSFLLPLCLSQCHYMQVLTCAFVWSRLDFFFGKIQWWLMQAHASHKLDWSLLFLYLYYCFLTKYYQYWGRKHLPIT